MMTDFKTVDECEKQRLVEDESAPPSVPTQSPSLRQRLSRHVLPCLLLLLSVSILFRKVFVCHHQHVPNKYLHSYGDVRFLGENGNTTKVALEAHIMSKCPDAKDCLQQLVVPAMAEVSGLVDFKLSYIGSFNQDNEEVQCKHGPSECLGNIIQLCAADEYPEPIIYLGFANCMIADYKDIPKQDLVESCAMEHGIDFQRLNKCISQEGAGMHLLRESVKHSAEEGVSTSCTVRLENKVRCVRDGGQWKDCPGGSSVDDLVTDIMELFVEKNSQSS